MFDLKTINSTLTQLEEERGVPKEKVIEAIEMALAAAYKKEYGKKGQIVKATFDPQTGKTEFSQIRIVVDESMLRPEDSLPSDENEDEKVHFNEEHHIMLADAQKIRKDVKVGEEMIFPLETKSEYGRIAAQTAKQVIIQRIREAEKLSVLDDFGKKQGEIVMGRVQRIEKGNVFVDLGRTTGILSKEEQIQGEHYRQGERIKAYLYVVEETPRGINLRLSRSHPQFVAKLFETETPEIVSGTVVIKSVAREAGSRSKVAVMSTVDNIDPVGSCVGQRGVRVSTVINELGGEKIDIIEWSGTPETFISSALSPAKIQRVELNAEEQEDTVTVAEDQFSIAIGKGGQNVRLAARLTGWKIDIRSVSGEKLETQYGRENGIDRKNEEV
jgi:N utilization substance protein A